MGRVGGMQPTSWPARSPTRRTPSEAVKPGICDRAPVRHGGCLTRPAACSPTSATEASEAMDAVKLLKDDHEKVKGLFRQFEKARSEDRKKELADAIMMELEVHSKIEEEIFYPAVREKGGNQQQETVAEAVEEHHVVDVLMQEIKQLEPSDERFEAKMTVLIENVEHHIEEEEQEMLPDAKKKLGKEVEALGDQMEQRKQQLMAAVA